MQTTFQTAYSAWQEAYAAVNTSSDQTIEQEKKLDDDEASALITMLMTPVQSAAERAAKLETYIEREVAGWNIPQVAAIKVQIMAEAADGTIH